MYIISIHKKGARQETMEKLVEAIKVKYPDASISVQKKEPVESRADRFSEAQGLVSDGKSVFEELRDELQAWVDGMPENLQNGSKADEINEAISALDDVINQCEEAEGADVSFPSMMQPNSQRGKTNARISQRNRRMLNALVRQSKEY